MHSDAAVRGTALSCKERLLRQQARGCVRARIRDRDGGAVIGLVHQVAQVEGKRHPLNGAPRDLALPMRVQVQQRVPLRPQGIRVVNSIVRDLIRLNPTTRKSRLVPPRTRVEHGAFYAGHARTRPVDGETATD